MWDSQRNIKGSDLVLVTFEVGFSFLEFLDLIRFDLDKRFGIQKVSQDGYICG